MMQMRKPLMMILGLLISLNGLMAQTSVKPEMSDPKAKILLDKVKKLYEGYQALETGFTLTLKLAEQKKEEVQKGKIFQEGDKYRAEFGKTLFMSDGKTVWQKDGNIVRVMNASSKKSNELMSPKDLMSIYEKKDYIYAIMGEASEGWSKKATIITFKPTGRKGDYSQIRVAIDQKTNQVVSMTAFGKDQSRYKLVLDQPITNKKYPADYFAFDKSKFPNVKVEDLRID